MGTSIYSGNENEAGGACSWQAAEAGPDGGDLSWPGGEVHLWRAYFSAWRSQAARLAQTLNGWERERMQRFREPEMAVRYAIGRGLLRELLGKTLGAEAAGLDISTNAYGKPELVTPVGKTLHFNLAHTDDLVLYGFTEMRSIGVDVERVVPGPVPALEARRIFSDDEWAAWHAFADGERKAMFTQTWVRKEAVLKALGVGLSIEPDTFAVGFASGPQVIRVQGATVCFCDLPNKAPAKAAVALTGDEIPQLRCFTALAPS